MIPTFSGLEAARRALLAQRIALDVTSHNIANANTPGYSRQIPHLAATDPFATPSFNQSILAGQMGTGVHVSRIQRATDAFVRHQINVETHAQGYWEQRAEILREIELTFLEPSGTGIRSALDQFWESLQELSKSPESQAVRSVVRERALVLADTISSTYLQLEPLRDQLDLHIESKAGEINALTDQIAAINREISAVLAAGDQPNDLLDQRDQLLERMSRIVDISVVDRGRGLIAVGIGGVAAVDGIHRRAIVATDADNDGHVDLQWADSNLGVSVRSGELKALIEGRDADLPRYLDGLNELAIGLIRSVNEAHRQGYGLGETFDPNVYDPFDPDGGPPPPPPGRNFFKDETDHVSYVNRAAANLALSDEILADVGNIAASSNGAVGDGSNALALAQLKQGRSLFNGTASANEFLASMVSEIGVQAQKTERMIEHQAVLIGHLDRLRSSVSGVSLDEEMTNLIQYQHAYVAASRVVTAMDEALEIIVNRMGIVGR